MKWLSLLIEVLRAFFSTYDKAQAEAQVDAEEKKLQDLANAPRTDDEFAARLLRYDDEFNGS